MGGRGRGEVGGRWEAIAGQVKIVVRVLVCHLGFLNRAERIVGGDAHPLVTFASFPFFEFITQVLAKK